VNSEWFNSHERVEVSDQQTLPGLEDLSSPSQERLLPGEPFPRRRLRPVLFVLGGVVLAGAIGGVSFVAWSNYDRAERWQARATKLERNNRALNGILIDRSERLNARTRELNAMAGKVRRAEATLARSEADVKALERRQRELANEKAQVEDDRAQLTEERNAIGDVAAAFIRCKTGLADILAYVANDDYASAGYYAGQVDSDCQYADDSLQSYLATYGG
jgi:hypothetical protein